MFGFGKAKLFQTHQTLLYQCMHFGEFALGLAQENADEDQIEFWETKLARITKLRDASLRKNGILERKTVIFWKRCAKNARKFSTKPSCQNNNLLTILLYRMADGKIISRI